MLCYVSFGASASICSYGCFFPFIQPDLTQTGDEEINDDISRLEDKYREQVVSDCNVKIPSIKSLSLSLSLSLRLCMCT